MDAQRRYLGGDSDHSILVKGLDFALLEQNKARLASTSSKQDDEALEEVFAQTASTSSAPASKKRSRADIIKELKEKRANEDVSKQLSEEPTTEKRADSSKFRPIGFKPVGAPTEKVNKKKEKEGSRPKKKKRKLELSTMDAGEQGDLKGTPAAPPAPVEHAASTSALSQLIRPEPSEDDFDIFADAGEYKACPHHRAEAGSTMQQSQSQKHHHRHRLAPTSLSRQRLFQRPRAKLRKNSWRDLHR